MAIKVFISHASADEQLASSLVDCLYSSMVLDDADVRCTSVPGHKLPVGSETAQTLRDELEESSVVVGLITRNAIASSWVLFELGATWGARRNLMPLLTNQVSYNELPGPLAAHHAAKMSDKSDVTQFIEEIAKTIGAKLRTGAKIDASIDKLIIAHKQSEMVMTQPKKPGSVKKSIKEPTISGMPFSELYRILWSEKMTITAAISGEDEDVEISLFEIVVGNIEKFVQGVQSNWGSDSAGGFLYVAATKMMPYELFKYEKLPATQAKWFKRAVLTTNGNKFIAHYKRLVTAQNKADE